MTIYAAVKRARVTGIGASAATGGSMESNISDAVLVDQQPIGRTAINR
jgi:hypothetical protein